MTAVCCRMVPYGAVWCRMRVCPDELVRGRQTIFDPMHCIGHGAADHNIKCAAKIIMTPKLEEDMGCRHHPVWDSVMARMELLRGKYSPPDEPHIILARMQDSLTSIPETARKLFLKKVGRTEDGDDKGSGPITSASDMELIAVCMPFLFHNIATSHVAAYNQGKSAAERVQDPSKKICQIFIDHLRWWKRFRRLEQSTVCVSKLDVAGDRYLNTLTNNAPFTNMKTGRSVHDKVKLHAVRHFPRSIALLGQYGNGSAAATETKHKFAFKTIDHLTNQHAATRGKQLLANNVRRASCLMMTQVMAGDAVWLPYGCRIDVV